MTAKCLAVWLAGACAATSSSADTPLSAIDWLTDTLNVPLVEPDADADLGGRLPAPIDVQPLTEDEGTATGLLPPSMTGFPANLWGSAEANQVVAEIEGVPGDLLPSLRKLFVTMLLAETTAPTGGDPDDAILLARVDRLRELGALDEARALIERAGITSPERFSRWFDLALIAGDEDLACAQLINEPALSENMAARVFCLARTGDWQAAALIYEGARALGLFSKLDDVLLAAYLDIDPEGASLIPPGETPGALEFRLHEATGDPIPSAGLPLIFAHADLGKQNGWKARLDAAERLARSGALSGDRLAQLYTLQKPSASGGVWDRAASVAELETLLAARDVDGLSRAVAPFWRSATEARLESAAAQVFGPRLSAFDLPGEAGSIAFRMALLTPDYELAAQNRVATSPDQSFLIAVALGNAAETFPVSAQETAIRDGFTASLSDSPAARALSAGQTGSAILRAISLFNEGSAGDLDGVAEALAIFRALGLQSTAQKAALELLTLEQRG